MTITGAVGVFLMGCAGGAVAEVLHWWALRRDEKLPRYAASVFYWAITAVMLLCGGLVTWLYFGERAEGLVALHVGLSTPLILQKLASSMPEPAGARSYLTERASVKDFFRW
jgi:hypothetical protein